MKRTVILCFVLLLLCGIASAETRTGDITIDGISFVLDARVTDNDIAEASHYTARQPRWGESADLPIDPGRFLSDVAEMNEYATPDGQSSSYWIGDSPDTSEEMLVVSGGLLYYTPLGNSLSADLLQGMSMLREGEEESMRAILREEVYQRYYPSPSEVPSLERLSYAEALDIAAPYLDAAGILVGDPYYVEAWTQDQAKRFVYLRDEDPLPYTLEVWEASATEFYSIHYPIQIEGFRGQIVQRGNSPVQRQRFVRPMTAHAIVGPDGLPYLTAGRYLVDLQPAGNAEVLMSADDALAYLETVTDFFADKMESYTNNTDDITVERATIREIAKELLVTADMEGKGEYELTPVWTFYVEVERTMAYEEQPVAHSTVVTPFAIDAVTGERVL